MFGDMFIQTKDCSRSICELGPSGSARLEVRLTLGLEITDLLTGYA